MELKKLREPCDSQRMPKAIAKLSRQVDKCSEGTPSNEAFEAIIPRLSKPRNPEPKSMCQKAQTEGISQIQIKEDLVL